MVYLIFTGLVAAFLLIPTVALPVPRAAGQHDAASGSRLTPRDTELFVPPPLPLPYDIAPPIVPRSSKDFYFVTVSPTGHPTPPTSAMLTGAALEATYLAYQNADYPYHIHGHRTPIAERNHPFILEALPANSKYLAEGMFAAETKFAWEEHTALAEALRVGNSEGIKHVGSAAALNETADDFAHDNSGSNPSLHPDHVDDIWKILMEMGAGRIVLANVGEVPLTPGDLATITTCLRGGKAKWHGIVTVFNEAYTRHVQGR